MSTDRDVTRIVRSWLEEGVAVLPDRVLDNVLDQLPATPQRRPLWPARRFNEMNALTKFAAAAAAVAVVAVVGMNLLPGMGGVGAPGPTPSPSPSASPTASPIPLPPSGSLEPGTYTIDDRRFTQATHFVFTVPDGWKNVDPFIVKGDGKPGELGLTTWVVSHAFTDSCAHTPENLVEVGTSPDALVNVLVALKNRVVSQPTNVTIGGFPAKRLEMAVPPGLDVSTCKFGAIKNWPEGDDDTGGLCCGGPGFVDVVYVVDINGKSLAIVARHLPGSSAEDLAELQGIIDSIHIDP